MARREESSIGKKLISYFIGIIMVGSAFGVIFFGFGSNENAIKYKEFKFYNKGDLWSVKIDGKEALFTNLPDQVSNIDVEAIAISKLKGSAQIDSTSKFNDTLAEPIALAQFQMSSSLNNFGIFLRNGFVENISNFPIISCEDATSFVPVLYFRSANQTKVYLENDCLIAESSNGAETLRLRDRLVYGILGILK